MAATKSKGFEIVLNQAKHILKTRAWGFWDEEFAKRYRSALTEKIEEIHVSEKGWYALADFIKFHPQSEEVQSMIREQIATASKQGMKKIAYLGKKRMIQLRFNHLFFQKSDILVHAFIESEEEAIRWLLSEQPGQ